MEREIREQLSDETYLRDQNAWFEKLRDIFEGDGTGPLVLNGIASWHQDFAPDGMPLYDDPARMLDADLRALAGRMKGTLREDQFRPACVEQGFYGVHFADRIFGSQVFFKSGQWYNRYLTHPVGERYRISKTTRPGSWRAPMPRRFLPPGQRYRCSGSRRSRVRSTSPSTSTGRRSSWRC